VVHSGTLILAAMQTLASNRALGSRPAQRACARRAEKLRSSILGVPKRSGSFARCNAQKIVSVGIFGCYSDWVMRGRRCYDPL